MRTKTLGALAGVAALSSVALGYATSVHKEFYAIAFGEDARAIAVPSHEDLAKFRSFIYQRATRNPEFARRWPSEASFDAAALKEFLALNPFKEVTGIDAVLGNGTIPLTELGRLGSVMPDDDQRNQNRMFVEGGRVVLDPFGRAVPYDPKTAWFGGIIATASQFDAHGAMIRTGKKGSGLLTALLHPEQFARPAETLGSAPEFSQTYTDLAAIAALRGNPEDEWLALQFGGNNMHGIEDLGNQIHCTLIGIPEFFMDAKITQLKQKLTGLFAKKPASPVPGGGIAPPALALTPEMVNAAVAKIDLGKEDEVNPRVLYALGKEKGKELTDVDIGIRIIGNHHRLLEDFFQKEYDKAMALAAAGRASEARQEALEVNRRAHRGDKAFEQRCREALARAGYVKGQKPGETEFARIICEVMVEHSAPEAAPIYRAIRKISKPELKRGALYPADVPGTDPLDYLTKTKSEETDLIFELHAKAFARVVTALRLWKETFDAETKLAPSEKDAAIQRVVDRMVARQLKYLDEAKARRDAYLAEKQAEFARATAPEGEGLLAKIKNWFR